MRKELDCLKKGLGLGGEDQKDGESREKYSCQLGYDKIGGDGLALRRGLRTAEDGGCGSIESEQMKLTFLKDRNISSEEVAARLAKLQQKNESLLKENEILRRELQSVSKNRKNSILKSLLTT